MKLNIMVFEQDNSLINYFTQLVWKNTKEFYFYIEYMEDIYY